MLRRSWSANWSDFPSNGYLDRRIDRLAIDDGWKQPALSERLQTGVVEASKSGGQGQFDIPDRAVGGNGHFDFAHPLFVQAPRFDWIVFEPDVGRIVRIKLGRSRQRGRGPTIQYGCQQQPKTQVANDRHGHLAFLAPNQQTLMLPLDAEANHRSWSAVTSHERVINTSNHGSYWESIAISFGLVLFHLGRLRSPD
jgi:hypothetical protein